MEEKKADLVFDDIKKITSQISDLKISDKISYKNPIKKFIYKMENKTKTGLLYKSFCYISLIYIVLIQISTFFYDKHLFFSIIPMTLWFVYSLICNLNLSFNNNSLFEYTINMGYSNKDARYVFLYLLSVVFTLFLYKADYLNVNFSNFKNYFLFDYRLPSEVYFFHMLLVAIVFFSFLFFRNIHLIYQSLKIRISINKKDFKRMILYSFIFIIYLFNINTLFHLVDDVKVYPFFVLINVSFFVSSFFITYIYTFIYIVFLKLLVLIDKFFYKEV